MAERGKRIGALDDPTKCEERNPSKNGGAPCLGVPSAVLPYRVPPLLSKGGWVWDPHIGWVSIVTLVT